MHTNRHTEKLVEKEHLKGVRRYYISIAEINLALSKIHKSILPNINVSNYEKATSYIHQYISHTTVWNLKFVMNLESPEVALLQVFHLEHIFLQEPVDLFIKERAIFAKQREIFLALKPFKKDHMERRHKAMTDFINQ